MSNERPNDMTLVLKRSALEQLVDPTGAIEDAKRWTEYIGITSARTTGTKGSIIENKDIEVDFVGEDLASDLATTRQQFPTERHVLVGESDDDRKAAQSLGVEYLSINEAANKAEWVLHSEDT
jgi:acid phosphatase class B